MIPTSKLLTRFRSLQIPHLKSSPHFSSASQQTPCSDPLQSLSYASILQQIKHPNTLQQAHASLITSGLAHNICLSNRLMNCYCSFGLTSEAELIFRRMPRKNVVSWTILISGFSHNDRYVEALWVFLEMTAAQVSPNSFTIVSVLPACAFLGLTKVGRSIHGCLVRWRIQVNVYVETALVDFYAKCGNSDNAFTVFEKMPDKNVVPWNAIILGFSNNGSGEKGLSLFNRMQRNGVAADFVTVTSLLSACSSIGSFGIGAMVHCFILRCGFQNDVIVRTAAMDMYVKCGHVKDAYQIFQEKTVKDVFGWTLMMAGFSDIGYGNKAMEVFYEMMTKGDVVLDSIALMGVLSCCSRLGALQQGRRVHGLAIKTGLSGHIFVGTAVIDMYANCASLESARSFFYGMVEKDVVCWNAMISGEGMNGFGTDAIDLFLRMKESGLKPDEATYVCILCACSHAGVVDQGIDIFNSMVEDSGVMPNLQHYACVVDLLGRAGRLDEAHLLISNMPLQPDADVYGVLLSACRNHGNISLGLVISEKLFMLDPKDAGYYVLLSNMYALAGNWDGVKMTRVILRSKGFKKAPGFSLIEIDRKIYAFTAGDRDHPQYHEVDELLNSLIAKIELVGYVPATKFVFQDVTEHTKKDILYHHSEKLAIAFGLLRSKPGTTIRVTKNLRMCNDCHTASKFISKVVGREIVVKDANRFHYIQEGACSCGDYW